MIIRLQHQRSDGDVDTYHLKSGRRYHIGRGSGCEVRILDLKLSRKHCAVEYIEGEWKIVDLLSTNGCKVDGDQIVGSQPLRVGSAIEIGQSTISVLRILGDDEGDDEGEAEPAASRASAAPSMTQAAPPKPSEVNGHAKADKREKPSELFPHPLEQEQLPPDEDEAPTGAPAEHRANDWEPEPEPEQTAKTGALVPNSNPQLDAKADAALEAARKAANAAADQARSNTGQLQRMPPVKPAAAPLSIDAPEAKVLPTEPPRSDGSSAMYRNTPSAKRPSPLPTAAPPELESGPFKSLDPRAAAPPRPDSAATSGSGSVQRPSSSIHRPKIVPVIIQPIDPEAVDHAPRAPAPAAAEVPPAAPPAPAAPAPAEAPPMLGAVDERTFFITVFGRRIGPLTRAVARDIKARELKGTLTLKDLDQYK